MPRIDITDAESEILAALLRRGPLSTLRLLAEVKARRDWSDPTIKTLLQRLMHKKLVRSEKDDGRLQYRALIDRETWARSEIDDLVRRVFDGDQAAWSRYMADNN